MIQVLSLGSPLPSIGEGWELQAVAAAVIGGTALSGGAGLHLRSPEALVGELSGGQRQGVAIARAMHFKSKVMILDESTNHLVVNETQKVIGFVRSLKALGITGIFISHNIHHVFECCDPIVAMARGEVVLDKRTEDTNMAEILDVL